MSEEITQAVEPVVAPEPVIEEASHEEVVENHADTEPGEEQRKSGFEKRVHKLNQKISAAEQEANFWKAEALKNAQAQQAQRPAEPMAAPGKPTLEQCGGNWEVYTDAVAEWKVSQYAAQQKHVQTLNNYQNRVAEFAKTAPDFHEALADVANTPVHNDIKEVIFESDAGPAIAYYLAQNPDEIAKLNAMDAKKRLLMLGKLEDKFDKKPLTMAKSTKSAPAPVKPVSGAAPAANKSVYDMSKEELRKYLSDQNKAELARRRGR